MAEGPVDVAVLVLNYQGRGFLGQTLTALRQHTPTDGIRVVVIDNGSSDNSEHFVRSSFPGVEVLQTGRNLGFAGGMNKGIRTVEAQAYALVNSDAQVMAGWLDQLRRTASSDRGIGIVAAVEVTAPGIARFREDGAFLARRDKQPVVDLGNVSLACALVKREVFDRIGLLDEGFFMYYEDLDFSRRARAAGYRTVLDTRVEVLHEGRASFNRQPGGWKVRVRTVSRQRYELLHGNGGWRQMRRELGMMAYWTTKGHPLAYLQGCWTTLLRLREIRARRTWLRRNGAVGLAHEGH